ncbi:stannin isoform X2 [Poecile atricapillus]|uniref:stannin isoform X2 n=1 Tax=Poecile atricapillus TaxID=48891 RepID=UPI0027392352|nr:stannin isoform X2 [Poecile atricapillus]
MLLRFSGSVILLCDSVLTPRGAGPTVAVTGREGRAAGAPPVSCCCPGPDWRRAAPPGPRYKAAARAGKELPRPRRGRWGNSKKQDFPDKIQNQCDLRLSNKVTQKLRRGLLARTAWCSIATSTSFCTTGKPAMSLSLWICSSFASQQHILFPQASIKTRKKSLVCFPLAVKFMTRRMRQERH